MAQRSRPPVLIAEDNWGLAEALQRILAAVGHETVTAGDGLDALSWLRAGGQPSLIVLDLKMPNMDGEAFERAVKADSRWRDIPIVVFSAYASRRASMAQAAAVVAKSDPDALVAAVASLTRQQ